VSEQFVGEEIRPTAGAIGTRGMTRREPGLPRRFTWRGDQYEVARMLEKWKETGPCTSGGTERYVRKHWYRLRTTAGQEMVVYFERQARRGSRPAARWWLYALVSPNET